VVRFKDLAHCVEAVRSARGCSLLLHGTLKLRGSLPGYGTIRINGSIITNVAIKVQDSLSDYVAIHDYRLTIGERCSQQELGSLVSSGTLDNLDSLP